MRSLLPLLTVVALATPAANAEPMTAYERQIATEAQPGTDLPSGGPAYRLVIEVVEPDGAHVEKDWPITFPTLDDAFAQVKTLHRSGACWPVFTPPESDPDLAGLCYPPDRIVRTRILLAYFFGAGEQ